jgi:hypothetical protein
MNRLNKLERKFDWLAFPGLFKCLTIIGALVYGISWTKPEFGLLLNFDKAKILAGEWWRIPTFLFASQGMGPPNPISLLFFLCAVSFAFTISDSLEREWGTTRTTLFLLLGWISLLAGSWFAPAISFFPGTWLFTTTFLAFAWFYPDYPLRLFFFIPVPCHVFAKLDLVVVLFLSMVQPALIPFLLVAHLNLLIWVGPLLWKSRKLLFKARAKRREFQSKLRPVREAFHTCNVCQRTEHHAPSLDFRVGHDGREYCDEHLPS